MIPVFGVMVTISCRKGDNNGDPLITKGYTTLDRTIITDPVTSQQPISIDDVADYAAYGYGFWHYGPGAPYQKRIDLMPAGYDISPLKNEARLLRFFTLTDVHITDKESPVQAIFFAHLYGSGGIGFCTPLMLYTTHLLDAIVRTINGLHKQNPFDFGIALGDLANNTQYNELRWFIDIMDGKNINPDSGDKDDPIPGPGNDYQDEFLSEGLDHSIPWYAVIGNHDHFFIAQQPVNDYVRQTFTGVNILQLGNVLTEFGNALNERTYSLGTMDGSTLYGTTIGSDTVANMETIPTIAPDANRRSLTKTEWYNEFNTTTSLPQGHGFPEGVAENAPQGCYAIEPKSNLPLKVIGLDDTMDENDISPNFYGYGTLSNGRYEWLISELDAGQSEGKLMIIAAHIPLAVKTPGVNFLDSLFEKDLIDKLRTYPNLILWISGHLHRDKITPFISTDSNHPENSFWQVETKSVREFPEQFRTIDIVRNSDNTISIFATDVDADIKDGSLAATGRSMAIASAQIYKVFDPPNPNGALDYNAELVKQLFPEMQIKIRNYGTPIIK
jgi:metallophosphoesterase (TIGR03768 family)